jgi:hypothetical protein
MIINSSNLNTLTDLTTTSLSVAILNINLKNFEINKKILAIEESDKSNELLKETIHLLKEIQQGQQTIIDILTSSQPNK